MGVDRGVWNVASFRDGGCGHPVCGLDQRLGRCRPVQPQERLWLCCPCRHVQFVHGARREDQAIEAQRLLPASLPIRSDLCARLRSGPGTDLLCSGSDLLCQGPGLCRSCTDLLWCRPGRQLLRRCRRCSGRRCPGACRRCRSGQEGGRHPAPARSEVVDPGSVSGPRQCSRSQKPGTCQVAGLLAFHSSRRCVSPVSPVGLSYRLSVNPVASWAKRRPPAMLSTGPARSPRVG